MHGAGTKTAITTARSFPALLDVTRLTSRVGRGPHTGVDRVELAYLEWCLATEPELVGLAKVSDGYVFLDRSGLKTFHQKIIGQEPWGARDIRAVIGLKTPAPRGAAESDLRRLAVRHCDEARAISQLRKISDHKLTYLNIGHSNISKVLLEGVNAAGHQTAVFLHDLIPLEHPEFQRGKSVESFKRKTDEIIKYASLILTNSHDSEKRIKELAGQSRTAPEIASAHLGIDVPIRKKIEIKHDRPYFVILGTIEPRKNHALLLDIWDDFASEHTRTNIPRLHIIGQRGWVTQDVITRLDHLPHDGAVIEHKALPDDALWPLIVGAHGLLFPSFAEGFGLPSLEAAALGVPVICGDLAIHHELLGDYPVYADPQDRYLWKKTIIEQAGTRLEDLRKACATRAPHIPTWDEHFDRINTAVMGLT